MHIHKILSTIDFVGVDPSSLIKPLVLLWFLSPTPLSKGAKVSLNAPKSQRFLRNCDARRGPQKALAISKTRKQCCMRFKGAMESRRRLRFRAAISEPETPSFCGISGDLAPSTRKSLAIAIVRFWCAKVALDFLISEAVMLENAVFPRRSSLASA